MSERIDKDQPAQLERSNETARNLSCDDDKTAFGEKLRLIVKREPKGALDWEEKP
jgi:hypothetical protein